MTQRVLGEHFGAVTTGMSWLQLASGAKSFPFHCHSAEEELFVVLDGDGTLRLGDERHRCAPAHRLAPGRHADRAPVRRRRRGHDDPGVQRHRPQRHRVLSGLQQGEAARPGRDVRVEPVDYWDGED